MARITVVGGTGYAGAHIVIEAAGRGHEVTAVSRTVPAPDAQVDGVTYVAADVTDPDAVAAAVDGADVVVAALSPRGDMAGKVRGAEAALATAAAQAGARLGVIGGAGSLHVAPGGPRLVDTDEFPAAFKDEALELTAVLGDLQSTDDALDWFFLSPAVNFGAYAPGERTGSYRVGDDDLPVADADGTSAISGADLAIAVVDEIETPAHHRARFTVGY